LIEKARHIGKHKAKKPVVAEVFNRYIQRCRQSKIIHLFGKVDYDPGYDYKEQRNSD
jgi:hypothetical protein